MRLLIFPSDKTITAQKKNGAERIQRRVQIGKLGGGNHRGKMSGINIRIKKTHRMNGESAIHVRVFFSSLRCMKCRATSAAFHTAKTISKATSEHFRQVQIHDCDFDDSEREKDIENPQVMGGGMC